jgi:hypothetical protein
MVIVSAWCLTLPPGRPGASLLLPFYVYLFGAVLIGVVLGGMAMWMTQARWRRMARRRGADAVVGKPKPTVSRASATSR